jgi:glycerol kinase
LKVDGGASNNNFLMQFQSNILDNEIRRPKISETTALGACYLAGVGIGLWKKEELSSMWALDRSFSPKMDQEKRDDLYRNWQRALKACVAFADKDNY